MEGIDQQKNVGLEGVMIINDSGGQVATWLLILVARKG